MHVIRSIHRWALQVVHRTAVRCHMRILGSAHKNQETSKPLANCQQLTCWSTPHLGSAHNLPPKPSFGQLFTRSGFWVMALFHIKHL